MNNLKNFIIITSLVLVTIVSINILIDPSNLYSFSPIEHEISDKLAAGYYVSGFQNYDERILQRNFVQKIKKKPSIGIFGSSRTMQLFIENESMDLVNFSVPNAVIEDYFAIIWNLIKSKKLPKTIYFEVSPWILNRHNKVNYWKSWGEDYENMHALVNHRKKSKNFPILNSEKIVNLVSPSYFQSSLKYAIKNLVKNDFKQKKFIITNKIDRKTNTKHPNGHLSYGKNYTEMTKDEVDKQAYLYGTQTPLDMLDRFKEVDSNLLNDLKNLINFLKINYQVEVILVMMPYHPLTYQALVSREDIIKLNEVEKIIKEEFSEYKINGSFNPNNGNFINSDFYDALHLRYDKIKNIFIK